MNAPISVPEGLSIYAELAFSCSNRTVHGIASANIPPTSRVRPASGLCRAGLFARWSPAVDAAWPNTTGASVSGTKKDCSWGSMDKGRCAGAQSAFESSNAATGDREEDETNRAGASAKGGNSRHRPGTSPLTLRCCKSAADPHRRGVFFWSVTGWHSSYGTPGRARGRLWPALDGRPAWKARSPSAMERRREYGNAKCLARRRIWEPRTASVWTSAEQAPRLAR
jgi:hypothetical protein